MTGEQLYKGWSEAAKSRGLQCIPWEHQSLQNQLSWSNIADVLGPDKPTSPDALLQTFAMAGILTGPVSIDVVVVANELVKNWSAYYFNFSGQISSEHTEGDEWLFKASGIRARVQAVAGSQVILKINGVDTGWIEIEELAKDAKKV